MTTAFDDTGVSTSAPSRWQRLHQTLLPDYNRRAAVYWWTMVAAGTVAIAAAGGLLVAHATGAVLLQVALGVGAALFAGFFPLRVPGSRNSFVAGEIFIFALLLAHGPAAATLASAAEAAVGSWRTSKRWSSRLASPAISAVAMTVTGHLFEAARGWMTALGAAEITELLVDATGFSLVYFVLNTLLVTLVPKLKRNEGLQLTSLFSNFGWAGLSYTGSAIVAVLVVITFRQAGPALLVAGVPIIALLLSTLHLFFRQQEAAEQIRRNQLDAIAREQEQATRHLNELRAIAFHDSLTGLPNRRRLMELLGAATRRGDDGSRPEFALLYLDFDRFKLINDSLGHSAGDDFLVQVSRLLQQHVRPQDVVARLGGDEFAVLVEGQCCVDHAVALAERLLRLLALPISINGTQVHGSASIGITSSAVGYAEPSEVLRDADIAMYRAKAAGRARYALFDVSLRGEVSQRLMLEGELRRAIAAHALSVVYQPLFSLDHGKLVGFEALARWEHPTMGAIGPDVFIPIAEESGLIVQITEFVIHEACLQLKRFQHALPWAEDLTMHVNLSTNDVAQKGFVSRVTRAIAAAELKPSNLTLELTENILMTSLEDALPMLGELHALGFRLSVDDFGTGCSSLRHLSRLPLDSLKIDRSFVASLSNISDRAIVKAIVSLAHALGKSVVAEGIETPEQLEQLRALGCQAGQGYYMSRPRAGVELEGELRLGGSACALLARLGSKAPVATH